MAHMIRHDKWLIKSLLPAILSVTLAFSAVGCEDDGKDERDGTYNKQDGRYRIVYMDSDYTQKVRVVGDDGHDASNVYSVAKLFTALAVGMCVDENLLSVDDLALHVLGVTLADGQDKKWENVTVDMLLTHKAGFNGSVLDIDVDDVHTYGTDNYLQYVLSQPLDGDQGIDYQYTDGAYYLLSLIVEAVTGQTLYDYLRPTLFGVMGFTHYAWETCPLGHTMGATGLFLTAEDVVKLGLLYADNGVWKEERIVSEGWIELSMERGYSLDGLDNGWYCKGGMYGQAVAFHAENRKAFSCIGYAPDIDLSTVFAWIEEEDEK